MATSKFPCSSPPSTCDEQANPLTTFSSEAQDSTTFIGLAWSPQPPGLDKPFTVYPCEAIAESKVSQSDADRIAANQALVCSLPCTPLFTNTAQTATGKCADGSQYAFTIPAGLYTADSQLLADRIAFTVAEQSIPQHSICLSPLAPVSGCKDEFYFGQVLVIAKDNPVSISLIGGDVPAGMTLRFESDRVVLQGTPHAFGTHVFTILATSASGTFATRSYAVTVSGIVTSSIPSATQGVAYATQLQAMLPAGISFVWSITSGSLPAGLALDAAGNITGTPTGTGTSNFTVGVTAGGVTCTAPLSLSVASAGPACLADTGNRIHINDAVNAVVINSRSSAVRRLMLVDNANALLFVVNTQTNVLQSSIPMDVGNGGSIGDVGCFATSVGHFFIPRNNGGSGGVLVVDQDGNLVTTIANPPNLTLVEPFVYSADQDRVYTGGFSTIDNNLHIIEINPHTNAVTNNIDTGSTLSAGFVCYPGNLVLNYGFKFENYALPAITNNKTLFLDSAQEAEYVSSVNRIFTGMSDGDPNPIVSIDPVSFTVDTTYNNLVNMGQKQFIKYNPVTGVLIGYSQNDSGITVIDPVAKTILCEITNTDADLPGSIGIDYQSGQVYLLTIGAIDAHLDIFQ